MPNNQAMLATAFPPPEAQPLADLVAALDRAVGQSEDDFLGLGMNLQKIQMMSSAQQKKIAATMGLFKTSGEKGIVQQISTYVAGSQTRTEQAQQRASQLCANLETMIRLIETFSNKCHSLERAALLLHVIGTHTGIECARYARMEATFKVVSQDTVQLSDQIHATTDALFEQTLQAKTEQTATLTEARKNISALQGLALSSNKTTETALTKVTELVNYSIDMVNEANHLSAEITSGINRVVVGIQFHDNLRQRAEHINQALLEVPIASDDQSAEELCDRFLLLELQKAQLDSLVQELENLHSTQARALSKVVEDIYGLQSRLGGTGSEKARTTGEADPVSQLLAGITTLERLNQDSQTLGRDIAASTERANQVSRKMQEAIESTFSIASQVKINALNAIIKAAKFGSAGEALQVLAQGMVSVSQEVRELVSDFNHLLEQLEQLTRNDLDATTLHQDTRDLEQIDVQMIFDQFATKLHTSRGDCGELAENLEAEIQGLDFIHHLKEELAVLAARLEEYHSCGPEPDRQMLEVRRRSFGEQHYRRYTIDEERETHRKILHGLPAVLMAPVKEDDLLFSESPQWPATTDAAGPGSGEIELFGQDQPPGPDEIELWGAAPPEAGGDMELFPQAESAPVAGGEVELFDSPSPAAQNNETELWDDFSTVESSQPPELCTDEEKAAQTPPPAPQEKTEQADKKAEDFGDNIELF
jgi:methyl-accepting chemotaxis protein